MHCRFAIIVPFGILVLLLATANTVNVSMATSYLREDSPIDFETIPGETPVEGLVISDQYSTSHGIIFSLENGENPVLARVGSPRTAFGGPPNHSSADTPAANQNIGSFFLTDDGSVSGLEADSLIVSYMTPTASASGVILDIDFDESFTIEARDESDSVLETITITAGDPNTGDGIATHWGLNRPSPDIYSIRFMGSRTSAGSFGLGFDNFSARSAVFPIYLPIVVAKN